MKKSKRRKNRIVIIVIIFVVIMFLGVFAFKSCSGKKKLSGTVIGYLPYYSAEYLDNIDFDAITHLNIAFTNPNSQGELENNLSDEMMKKIVDSCHKNGVKAIASFGGGAISSKNYNKIMRNSSSGIKYFNKKIIDYCKEHNLDGVDIDFEFIAQSYVWEYFTEWITDLKKQCKANDLSLSAAVADWYSDNIEDEALSKFDYIMIMAYDNDGASTNHSSYEYAVEELAHYSNGRGIDKKKIVLGVPFYGYKYNSSGEMNWNSAASYRYILSKNSSAKNGDESNGFAYNGPATIRKKAELSKEYGGIMVWELSQDASGKSSLLQIIKDVY